MPRNSAFKKATRAIAKTHKFFSYESPYPTLVRESEPCYGPCCAGLSIPSPFASAGASAVAPARAKRAGVIDSGKLSEISLLEKVSALEQRESDEIKADVSESPDDDDDHNDDKHAVPGKTDKDGFCGCKYCLGAQSAGVMHSCNPQDTAAVATLTQAKDEGDRAAARKFLSQAEKSRHQAENHRRADTGGSVDFEAETEKSLEELQEQVLAKRELRNVLRWAGNTILNAKGPLGGKALQQLMATLIASAKAGSVARLIKDTAKPKAPQREIIIDPERTETTLSSGEQASDQIEALRTAIVEAGVEEASMREMLKKWRDQLQACAKQSSHAVTVDAEQQEKIQQTMIKPPLTDHEYEKVSSRRLYIDGVLPHFPKDDVVQVLRGYGEVENIQVISHFRNQEKCWLGLFTMATSKAADAARKGLNGKVIGGHAWIVDKPPDARLMKIIQTQLKKVREAKFPPHSKKDKEQEHTPKEPHLSYVDKEYLSNRLQQMTGKEKIEVAEIISAYIPALKGVSKYNVPVSFDKLSDVVLLKLLGYLWKRFGCDSGDPRSRKVSQLAEGLGLPQSPAARSQIGKSSKQKESSGSLTEDGDNRKRRRAVTKWDILRGLKCAAEEFLEIGIAMADKQYVRFNSPSVANAPNLPTGAYTILRDAILAENVGNLLNRIRDQESGLRLRRTLPRRPPGHQPDDVGIENQSETMRAVSDDTVVRRWKSLKRDFPDVAAMIAKLQSERSQIQAWITSERGLSSSRHYIVAADDESVDAIAEALGDKDPHVSDDLAVFTGCLAAVNKDARFQLKKPEQEETDPKEIRHRELLELSKKIIGRYPGLGKLIMWETRMPYHPDHEEAQFGDE